MTPAEFKDWRKRLGLSLREATAILGFKDERHTRRLEQGSRQVSATTARLCVMIEETLARWPGEAKEVLARAGIIIQEK